ncbi:MAG TPA: aspartate carbamoyltransferase catalytic subunit [Bacillota bacterium]|nr:aspartate carbamoyltransferase catalytic subunit [Bacillota bacterium]HOB86089.1 aspartate carbamoyltransferase catalytic subunit [Bacillota bacterium]HOP69017.1 aspartate carbamoyltransferase catalytic subunit [Bacillota bacterium]HPT34076.1 aspartate carbamoyltransferase catalytic subunit [Bacillota bacterium]HPZ65639.1 aspartate carbamoyltransferase catalytic subunit [Bacillota bacterium]
MTRHMLGLHGVTAESLGMIMERAWRIRQNRRQYREKLKGKLIAALFFEPSTRTKLSFELAAHWLGAEFIHFPLETSSRVKGESLLDTILTVTAMGVDALIIRHSNSGVLEWLKEKVDVPLINAGDGAHEHPTQALLDLHTMYHYFDSLKDIEVVMVGDIQHSRVVRSSIWALKTLGARITLVGPPSLLPREFEQFGISISWRLDEVLPKADIVYLLRIQQERQQKGLLPSLADYTRQFGLTAGRLSLLKPGVLVMHPGPVNVGVEITAEALQLLRSWPRERAQVCIEHQVASGVVVRAALLDYLLGEESHEITA